MKSHGFLFTAPMIRAQLDGTKTQTRRLVTPTNSLIDGIGGNTSIGKKLWERLDWSRARASENTPDWIVPRKGSLIQFHQISPRIRPGDGYYAKETWSADFKDHYPNEPIWYRADRPWSDTEIEVRGGVRGIWSPESKVHVPFKWQPSIFMGRAQSRITGIIPQVRAQFVQDISEADAISEGIEDCGCGSEQWRLYGTDNLTTRDPIESFQSLWDSINTELGPVWAYTLERRVA